MKSGFATLRNKNKDLADLKVRDYEDVVAVDLFEDPEQSRRNVDRIIVEDAA